MRKEKKIEFDAQVQRALSDIRNGDKVCFCDGQEKEIFKDYTFRVASEYPQIHDTKHGRFVEVELANFGWVNIRKLRRIEEPTRFSDFEIEKGARCCINEPQCPSCPYNKFGITKCRDELDKDVVELLHRKDAYIEQLRQKGGAQ